MTKDNNHLEAINSLQDSGLIIKHSTSNELYPVFIVDRELFRKDFINELRKLFGADFDALSVEGRQILTCIYEFNKYLKKPFPSVNLIGNTLWAKSGKANTLDGYDDFKRRVRYTVSQMEKRKVITRVEGNPGIVSMRHFPGAHRSMTRHEKSHSLVRTAFNLNLSMSH